MPIDLLAARRSCTPMGARLYIGGGSKSSNATTNTDARVVGGDDSQNLSVTGSGNAISVTSTDHGAVSGALTFGSTTVSKGMDLALKGIESNAKTTQAVIEQQGSLLSGALGMVGEQQQQFTATLENLKGNDVRVLVIVGVAVVGLGAVALIGKKG